MPMNPGDIEDMIKQAIPGAKVVIRDLAGDGDLQGNMGGVLHALALQTSAPE